jgi:hypothetical protein
MSAPPTETPAAGGQLQPPPPPPPPPKMDPNLPLALARDNKAAELAALIQSGWPVNTGNKVGRVCWIFEHSALLCFIIKNVLHKCCSRSRWLALHASHLPTLVARRWTVVSCDSKSLLSTQLGFSGPLDESSTNTPQPTCRLCGLLLQMGQTPLHVAALWGNLDAVRVLIQHGANVNAQNMRCASSRRACSLPTRHDRQHFPICRAHALDWAAWSKKKA